MALLDLPKEPCLCQSVVCFYAQVYVRMKVTYLPAYVPSEVERHDADLYASNVRTVMAAASGQELSDMTNTDNMYVFVAIL